MTKNEQVFVDFSNTLTELIRRHSAAYALGFAEGALKRLINEMNDKQLDEFEKFNIIEKS